MPILYVSLSAPLLCVYMVVLCVCLCGSNAQFPALPSNPAQKSATRAAAARPLAPVKTTKTQKEEVTGLLTCYTVDLSTLSQAFLRGAPTYKTRRRCL